LQDRLGSVRDIVDNTGLLKDHIDYDGWGNVLNESGAFFGDRYKYTAREFDSETNLDYNRGRYYDPKAGRWISQDPMGFLATDSNLYRYVDNTTTNLTDPSGLLNWWGGLKGFLIGGPVGGIFLGPAGMFPGSV